MAPSRRKSTSSSSSTAAANPARRIITRSIYKKQKVESLEFSVASTTDSSSPAKGSTYNGGEIGTNYSCNDICSTPKGNKYMIPKISACPPAPKKKRLVLNCLSNSSSASPPSAKFFPHSDLEVFFLFAPRNLSMLN